MPNAASNLVRVAAVTEAACDLDVMALYQAYVRGLRMRAGGGAGHRVEVGTRRLAGILQRAKVLHATDVVKAAGAWADLIAGLAGVPRLGLCPLRRTIAVARVPDLGRLRIPSGAVLPMVIDAGDLLFSPSDETPIEPGDVQPDPLDVAVALLG
jgi:D-arginine dehydrogenase